MAEIEEAFTTYLKARAGLKALISTRFYLEELPQNVALPAVSYRKISDVKDHLLIGQSKLERPVFEFTSFALTKAVARSISNQLKAALSDYAGTLSGVVVQKIELQNEYANLEKSADGTIRVYTESLEYQINYERG